MELTTRGKYIKLIKLTKGMARMGAFDDLVRHRMKYKTLPQPKFSDINLDDLKGDDARAVVIAGLHGIHDSELPQLSGFQDGTWKMYTEKERHEVLLSGALVRGLDLFRQSKGDDYVKVPAKPRDT